MYARIVMPCKNFFLHLYKKKWRTYFLGPFSEEFKFWSVL